MNRNERVLRGILMVGLIAGMMGIAGAEEPAMNIPLPVAAPILDNGTNAPGPTNASPVDVNVIHTNEVKTIHPPEILPPVDVAVIPELDESAAWKATQWQVGTRYTQVKLQDKTRRTPGEGSFFGTITEITEKQDGFPNKVYLQYRLFDSPVWFGVSYDHVTARTMDDGNGDGIPDPSGGDGDEEIQGVIPYLHAAWDNATRLTPYAQAGIAFYQAKFLPNSWGDNGTRWVSAKSNVTGVELGGGLNVRIYKNLSADLFAKYMKIDDITGDWYYARGLHGGPFVMTMSYTAYGAGLSFRF
jgi:opacity protein-like surface antigen